MQRSQHLPKNFPVTLQEFSAIKITWEDKKAPQLRLLDPHLTTSVVAIDAARTIMHCTKSSTATCVCFIFSASRCDSKGTKEIFYSRVRGFPQPNLKELAWFFFSSFWISDIMKSYNYRCQITNVQRTYKLLPKINYVQFPNRKAFPCGAVSNLNLGYAEHRVLIC